MAGFCYIETIVKDPILPMSIFRSSAFTAVSISLCLGWMSFGMFQFYAPHLYVLSPNQYQGKDLTPPQFNGIPRRL